MDLFQDVFKFHRKFDLPTCADGSPRVPPPAVVGFRAKFMREEQHEFAEAVTDGDLAKGADALADLAYVICGTAHFFRIRMWLGSNPFGYVGNALAEMGLPHVSDGPPAYPHYHEVDALQRRMDAHLDRFEAAADEQDLHAVSLALHKALRLSLVTAHAVRVPFNDVWAEVQRANMAKAPNDGSMQKPRNEGLPPEWRGLDIMKPDGWAPPDVARVLREHVYVHHDKSCP